MYNKKELEQKMNKSVEAYQRELDTIRAGRANPKLLDGITFSYYGVETPIQQAATITVPEARLIAIQPWDTSNIQPIEKAILASDLGITPSNDGKIIRLPFPPLTEERRKELVKDVSSRKEEAKVVIRNLRRDAMDDVKKAEKAKEITEDDKHTFEEEIQKLTDKKIDEIDTISSKKEKELMEI